MYTIPSITSDLCMHVPHTHINFFEPTSIICLVAQNLIGKWDLLMRCAALH